MKLGTKRSSPAALAIVAGSRSRIHYRSHQARPWCVLRRQCRQPSLRCWGFSGNRPNAHMLHTKGLAERWFAP